MLLLRPAIAADPREFGRRLRAPPAPADSGRWSALAADLKLFAVTFTAGFVVVSVLIA